MEAIQELFTYLLYGALNIVFVCARRRCQVQWKHRKLASGWALFSSLAPVTLGKWNQAWLFPLYYPKNSPSRFSSTLSFDLLAASA